MKRLTLYGVASLCLLWVCVGAGPRWPWSVKGTITATPATIQKGEKSVIIVTGSNAVWRAELDGKEISLPYREEVSPETSTNYTATFYGRRLSLAKMATVTVTDPVPPDPVPPGPLPPDPTPPPPPPPDPNPPPTPGFSLSAVGIGSAFTLSDTLAASAANHDLATLIKSQDGTWIQIDPLMLDAAHPAALDAWVKLLTDSGKKQPAVIWHDKGKVLGIDEVSSATTPADMLTLAKSHLSKSNTSVVIHGKIRKLGLRPPKRGALPSNLPRVSKILTPLAEKDYPVNVDLRTQFLWTNDQGSYGSCVSQAVEACYTAAAYRSFGPKNAVRFSPNFLATVGGGWNGAYGADIIEIIATYGILPIGDMPNYSHSLPSDWKAKAAQYKALGLYGPPESNLKGYVAAAVKRGLPVAIAISVGSGFDPDSEGYITYARGSGRGVNHEVICAGGWFAHDGKKYILMKNSWGDFGPFGDGTAFIEDRFLQDDSDMWVIVVPSAAPSYKFDAPVPAPSRN